VSGLPRVCRSYQGGAAHGMAELGADDALDLYTVCVAASGASVGALLALGRAFGIDRRKVREAMTWALQENRIFDLHPAAARRNGLCLGDALREVIADLVGHKTTLGEAMMPIVIGATSLDARERGPRYLSKRDTPHVLAHDAGRASAGFPGVFANTTIPSLSPSPYWRDLRLHTDLGATDNTTDHVWDDPRWPPRVHLRLVGVDTLTSDEERVSPGENIEQALALMDAVVSVASRLKSSRSDGLVIDVPRIGNGLCFAERIEVLDARYEAGAAAVHVRADHLATLP